VSGHKKGDTIVPLAIENLYSEGEVMEEAVIKCRIIVDRWLELSEKTTLDEKKYCIENFLRNDEKINRKIKYGKRGFKILIKYESKKFQKYIFF
jgi:hypothetical protein